VKTHRQSSKAFIPSTRALLIAACVIGLLTMQASASGDQNATITLTSTTHDVQASRPDELPGRWSDAAPMSTGRTRFTITELKDGRVLVAGGRISHFPRAD